jgi:hypothetical protein
MTDAEIPPAPLSQDSEGAYRRGVCHAAEILLGAIGGKLCSSDQKRLNAWYENDLRPWVRASNKDSGLPLPALPEL